MIPPSLLVGLHRIKLSDQMFIQKITPKTMKKWKKAISFTCIAYYMHLLEGPEKEITGKDWVS